MNMDAHTTPNLTERQLRLLAELIRFYTEQAEPVSSKYLSEKTDLNISSATIRNDLGTLEQLGLIRAPHTSAGRVPTEEGYRYFVRYLLGEHSLSQADQKLIRAEFADSGRDLQKWLRTAASVLARHSQSAALVTEPVMRNANFKHLQLIATHGPFVLMILVLEGGRVIQQMLTLRDTPKQESLSQAAAQMNADCVGESAAGVRQKAQTRPDDLSREVLELVAECLAAANTPSQTLYWYGFSEVLKHFEDGPAAQQALRLLDENRILEPLLVDMLSAEDEAVRVLVGGEGRFEDMSELSLVVGRYGNQQLQGALSILGPKRMRYGRAISTVRYVATLVSAMIQDVYGTQET
jgi:heat-inducible transcriptional repressor